MSMVLQSAVCTAVSFGLVGEIYLNKKNTEEKSIYNVYASQLQTISALAALAMMKIAKWGTAANPMLTGALGCTAAVAVLFLPLLECMHLYQGSFTKNDKINDLLAWSFRIADYAVKLFNCYAIVTFATLLNVPALKFVAVGLTGAALYLEGRKIYNNMQLGMSLESMANSSKRFFNSFFVNELEPDADCLQRNLSNILFVNVNVNEPEPEPDS